jgi:elongator complex protein 3
MEEKIIQYIISHTPKTKAEFDNYKRKICSKLKIEQPSNRKLIQSYQNLLKKKRIEPNKQIEHFLKKAEIRTLSGIAVVTSLTKPYPCPGRCIYCPQEKGMPKSYLASEPAAARAYKLKFDPYEQMQKRILTLEANGHPTDKIEFIVKGGTWNAYLLEYQYWFILESFRACNDLSKKKQETRNKKQIRQTSSLKKIKEALEKEQRKNETTKHRIIGLTLETRPDAVTPETILHMRNQGCTRIELGLQAPDDKILKLVKRGHTVEQFKQAMLILRQAGFKVDLHFMPGLPGSTPKHDVEMYKKLFSDPGLKPDMVKIYPCTVIKNSPLYTWYKTKKYKPYGDKQLFEALIKMKLATPRYCRISRLIRDIPTPDIEAGNLVTNLREYLQKEMEKRGLKCQCLRCREIGHRSKTLQPLNSSTLKLFIDKYDTLGGKEYFLSFEDKKRTTVFGFLRLRLPTPEPRTTNCEPSTALIRELHVYGELVSIGKNKTHASQHKGLGKKLVAEAEKIAKDAGYQKIAVISGVGVRDYYRKLGYIKRNTYMLKNL